MSTVGGWQGFETDRIKACFETRIAVFFGVDDHQFCLVFFDWCEK